MKIRRTRLICVAGIDGSGKTTLALGLVNRLRDMGYDVQYVHDDAHGIQFLPILKPIKTLAKIFFMRGTNQQSNYFHYRRVQVSVSSRHRLLSGFYGGLCFLDYCAQAFVRVALPAMRGKTVVADRYIYDVLLNLALATARPLEAILHLSNIFFKLNIIPNAVFLVDTPEEIAFRRKSDIYSLDYLRERRSAYLEMARRFDFAVLDGQSDPDGLVSEAIARCFRTAIQPESS